MEQYSQPLAPTLGLDPSYTLEYCNAWLTRHVGPSRRKASQSLPNAPSPLLTRGVLPVAVVLLVVVLWVLPAILVIRALIEPVPWLITAVAVVAVLLVTLIVLAIVPIWRLLLAPVVLVRLVPAVPGVLLAAVVVAMALFALWIVVMFVLAVFEVLRPIVIGVVAVILGP